jgi:hypothetical protein
MSMRHIPPAPILGQGWYVLPEGDLAQHSVCVGTPGSGKTETLLRIAYGAAKVYNWQVFFLDAKGDRATAARFVAAMLAAGKSRVKMFPAASYNGWEGDGNALLNRLIVIEDFSDSYYRSIAKLMLSLAINAPGGLPKSSQELMTRLRLDTLFALYQGLPEEAEVAQIRKQDAAGVYNRYRAFFSMLGGRLDGSFAYEDVDAAYLLLDGLALREEAAGLGRFFVEDFAHFVAKRKPRDRKVLLLIDDFSALMMHADAVNLFERVRAYGASVIVSSQSYAALGRTVKDSERILSAANLLILHRCSAPEPLVIHAGKQKQVQASWRMLENVSTGQGLVRLNDTFLVPPDEVRRLHRGEAFIIAYGRAPKVSIAPLFNHPQALKDAENLIRRDELAQSPTKALPPAIANAQPLSNQQSSQQSLRTGTPPPPSTPPQKKNPFKVN